MAQQSVKLQFPPRFFFKFLDRIQQFKEVGAYCQLDKDTGVAIISGSGQKRGVQVFQKLLGDFQRLDKQEQSQFEVKGSVVATLPPSHVQDVSPVPFDMAEYSAQVQLITSYSWVPDMNHKSYMVTPGKIRTFRPPRGTFDLTERTSSRSSSSPPSTADLNKTMHTSLMEPILVALHVNKPNFKLDEIDLVTDRNNLRKIFRWCCGDREARFRVDFELFHQTILALRFDLPEKQSSITSRGQMFEDAVCQGDQTSYRALLQTRIGNCRVLLRCEVDCMEAELTSQLQSLNLNQPGSKTNNLPISSFAGSTLTFTHLDNSSSISSPSNPSEFIELKTRRKDRYQPGSEMTSDWFQSFIAGTGRLVYGLTDFNTVVKLESMTVEQLRQKMVKEDVLTGLKRLAATLTFIKEKVLSSASNSDDNNNNIGHGCKFSLLFEPNVSADLVLVQPQQGGASDVPDYIWKGQFEPVRIE